MKKLEKKDYYNIIFLLFLLVLYFIIITKGFKFLYGSTVDWDIQHYLLPDYFRKLFYETGNLFPSFAFNLGNGQNIYNFSYYGLLSPIIFLSYLLPFVKMVDYIQFISVLGVFVSTVLIYKWTLTKYNRKVAFYSSLLFITASPILFHSHRHIMFTCNMPFLILSLINVENYVKNGKKSPLILSLSLMILCNYYYSVSSLFCIFIYGCILILKDITKEKVKEKILRILKFIFIIILSILITMILLLPTIYVLLNGRAKTTISIDYLSLFIPNFDISNLLYDPYSPGVSIISLGAIIYGIINNKKEIRLLSILLSVIFIFPIFSFVLNGTMYIDNKIFIPFIPLIILLSSQFINDLIAKKITKKEKKVIVITTIVIALFNINREIISVFLLQLLILYLLFIFKNKKLEVLILILIFGTYTVSFYGDNLYSKESLNNMYKNDSQILSDMLKDENSLYRTTYQNYILHNINRVEDLNHYLSTVYSSSSNKSYRDYYYNFGVEVNQRSFAKISSVNNIFYNLKNSNKYMVKNSNYIMNGYIRVKDDDYLYINSDALPIIYGTSNILGSKYVKKEFPYNMDYELNNVIVDDDINNFYESKIKEYEGIISIINTGENIKINKEKESYIIDASKDDSLVLKIDNLNEKDILILSFDIENSNTCNNDDLKMTINGVLNVLTCSDWKYHNRNNNFKYVISSNEVIDKLNVSIKKGIYKISNIKMYCVNYDEITKYKENISIFKLDKEKTKGDIIKGSITLNEDGYIVTSIPYDEGFNIYLNGEKVNYTKVNDSFIGIKKEKGTYDIEIIYEAPLLKHSMIISSIGIIIYIGIIIKEIKDKKSKQKN